MWALANISADLDDVRLTLLELKITDELNKYTKIHNRFTSDQLKNIAWLITNISMTKKEEDKVFFFIYWKETNP